MQLSIFLFLCAALVGLPMLLTEPVIDAEPDDAVVYVDLDELDWRDTAWFFSVEAVSLGLLWLLAGWICDGLELPR